MKLPHTEVKFYLEVKSQTGLSSLRVSCKCALIKLKIGTIEQTFDENVLLFFRKLYFTAKYKNLTYFGAEKFCGGNIFEIYSTNKN